MKIPLLARELSGLGGALLLCLKADSEPGAIA
jgi:hypothetical protein